MCTDKNQLCKGCDRMVLRTVYRCRLEYNPLCDERPGVVESRDKLCKACLAEFFYHRGSRFRFCMSLARMFRLKPMRDGWTRYKQSINITSQTVSMSQEEYDEYTEYVESEKRQYVKALEDRDYLQTSVVPSNRTSSLVV